MLVLAVGGLIWAPYVTVEASLLQRVTPPAMLGRVFGVRRAVTAAAREPTSNRQARGSPLPGKRSRQSRAPSPKATGSRITIP